MSYIAFVGVKTYGNCSAHQGNYYGIVSTGSNNTISNVQEIARMGDICLSDCGHIGHINSASNTVFVNGLKKARIGDTFNGIYSGSIVGDSSFPHNVIVD